MTKTSTVAKDGTKTSVATVTKDAHRIVTATTETVAMTDTAWTTVAGTIHAADLSRRAAASVAVGAADLSRAEDSVAAEASAGDSATTEMETSGAEMSDAAGTTAKIDDETNVTDVEMTDGETTVAAGGTNDAVLRKITGGDMRRMTEDRPKKSTDETAKVRPEPCNRLPRTRSIVNPPAVKTTTKTCDVPRLTSHSGTTST